MGMGTSGYIFQVLVLRKYLFINQKEQLRIIFCILRASGLKVNSPRFSFVLKGVPYLGYVITSEGIKPDLNKVQGIMDIGGTTNTTEY